MTLNSGEPGSRKPPGYCIVVDGYIVSTHSRYFEADDLMEHFKKQGTRAHLKTLEEIYKKGYRKTIPN